MPINLEEGLDSDTRKSLSDFKSHGSSGELNGVDYSDYNDELANVIDERIENDSWRSNYCQCYYVTTVVEETLKRLPHDLDHRQRKLPDVRTAVQGDVAEDANIRKPSIQAHCHVNLFKNYEIPRKGFRSESQWVDLFDQLIRELDRTWYQNKNN